MEILIRRPALVISPQSPRGRNDLGRNDIVVRAGTHRWQWLCVVGRAVASAEESSTSRIVRDFSGEVAAVAVTPLAASRIVRRGVPLPGDLSELVADKTPELLGVVHIQELGDSGYQLVLFGLELDPDRIAEPAEWHLENVIRLSSDSSNTSMSWARPGLLPSDADDCDHVIDVENCHQQSFDQVPLLGLVRANSVRRWSPRRRCSR